METLGFAANQANWPDGVMHADIYIRASKDQPLEEFARLIFSRLGVARFEERESSNYVDGHYFRSIAHGLEVVIALADTQGLEEYRFRLTLTAEQSAGCDTSYMQDHAETLARLLSAHGWRCFVPDDVTTIKGEDEGTIYEARQASAANVSLRQRRGIEKHFACVKKSVANNAPQRGRF
jgi:hypothetical protein